MSNKEAELRGKLMAIQQREAELRESVNRAKTREAELLNAKKRLENNQRIKRAEIAKVCEQAKEEGRRSVIENILPVLPSPTNSMYRGAARTLNNDVRKILNQYQKKKNN